MEQGKALAELIDKLRCFNCRNRMGLDGARIEGEGLLVCQRCAAQQETLTAPGGVVDVVGL